MERRCVSSAGREAEVLPCSPALSSEQEVRLRCGAREARSECCWQLFLKCTYGLAALAAWWGSATNCKSGAADTGVRAGAVQKQELGAFFLCL